MIDTCICLPVHANERGLTLSFEPLGYVPMISLVVAAVNHSCCLHSHNARTDKIGMIFRELLRYVPGGAAWVGRYHL